ncbi:MAG TPA: hypothetical protein VKU41_13095 [Polyangiaceae bacterium]|nr:hypothetical protein [Polyangiaceae bacterium]
MWIRLRFDVAVAACLLATAAPLHAAPPPASPADPLSEYRERFKLGMDRYKSGALAEAIGYWEPIYRELGTHAGYRVAYDLGVAYAELGDATHAAERLQSFLDELQARRAAGEPLSHLLGKDEADALTRINNLTATKGRLRIDPGTPPRAVQVDANEPRIVPYVAWVSPGSHTVTFGPGTRDEEKKSVSAAAGEIVDVAPSPPVAPAPAPTPAPMAMPTPGSAATPAPAPAAAPARETTHPFSINVLYASGGLALVATGVAVLLDNSATSLYDRYVEEAAKMGSIPPADRQSFATARTEAYAAIGTAIGLGVVTTALTAWFLIGTSHREVLVAPTATASPQGARLGLRADFW